MGSKSGSDRFYVDVSGLDYQNMIIITTDYQMITDDDNSSMSADNHRSLNDAHTSNKPAPQIPRIIDA